MTAAEKNNHLGINIADASALFTLCAEIPPELRDPNTPSHLETPSFLAALSYLARQGFHIIVPEMVAFETINILSHRRSISRNFDRPSQKYLEQDVSLNKKIRQFLLSNREIDIAQARPDNFADYAIFLRDLHQYEQVNPYVSDKIKNRTGKAFETNISQIKRRGILATLNKYAERKNWGDLAAEDIAKNLNDTVVPTFYLSDDHEARKKITDCRSDRYIFPLSSRDFVLAANNAGLFVAAGVATHTLENAAMRRILNKFVDQRFKNLRNIGLENSGSRRAFQGRLKQLIENRHVAPDNPDPLPTRDNPLPSLPNRIDRFQQRYGNMKF